MMIKNKMALSLVEVIVAVTIAVFAGFPILKMVTASRKDTANSANRLIAMELANEAIEWVNVTKYKDLINLAHKYKIIEEESQSKIISEGDSINTIDIDDNPDAILEKLIVKEKKAEDLNKYPNNENPDKEGQDEEEDDSELTTGNILTSEPYYEKWQKSQVLAQNLSYPKSDQYKKAYFYRIIEVESILPTKENHLSYNLLKKVKVTVMWSEGKKLKISDLDDPSKRDHQVELSVLVMNDGNDVLF